MVRLHLRRLSTSGSPYQLPIVESSNDPCQTLILLNGLTKFGRTPESSNVLLQLGSPNRPKSGFIKSSNMISRTHAVILETKNEHNEEEYLIFDISLNGTYVNDVKLPSQKSTKSFNKIKLKIGDTIKFGHSNGAAVKAGELAPQALSSFTFIVEKTLENGKYPGFAENGERVKQLVVWSETPIIEELLTNKEVPNSFKHLIWKPAENNAKIIQEALHENKTSSNTSSLLPMRHEFSQQHQSQQQQEQNKNTLDKVNSTETLTPRQEDVQQSTQPPPPPSVTPSCAQIVQPTLPNALNCFRAETQESMEQFAFGPTCSSQLPCSPNLMDQFAQYLQTANTFFSNNPPELLKIMDAASIKTEEATRCILQLAEKEKARTPPVECDSSVPSPPKVVKINKTLENICSVEQKKTNADEEIHSASSSSLSPHLIASTNSWEATPSPSSDMNGPITSLGIIELDTENNVEEDEFINVDDNDDIEDVTTTHNLADGIQVIKVVECEKVEKIVEKVEKSIENEVQNEIVENDSTKEVEKLYDESEMAEENEVKKVNFEGQKKKKNRPNELDQLLRNGATPSMMKSKSNGGRRENDEEIIKKRLTKTIKKKEKELIEKKNGLRTRMKQLSESSASSDSEDEGRRVKKLNYSEENVDDFDDEEDEEDHNRVRKSLKERKTGVKVNRRPMIKKGKRRGAKRSIEKDDDEPTVILEKKQRKSVENVGKDEDDSSKNDLKNACGLFKKCRLTNEITEVQWVQCDLCLQWWHSFCKVGENRKFDEDERFVCCKRGAVMKRGRKKW